MSPCITLYSAKWHPNRITAMLAAHWWVPMATVLVAVVFGDDGRAVPAARRRHHDAGCSERERGWVPNCELESWLGLMHGVGLAFGCRWCSVGPRPWPDR